MSWLKVRDSQGRESKTLAFVTLSFIAINARALSVWFFDALPPITLTEYGTAVAAVLAIWLGREFVKK
jgi:hypothetical protein